MTTRRPTFYELLDQFERELLTAALDAHGTPARAALALGLTPAAFQLKADRLLLVASRRPAVQDVGRPLMFGSLHGPLPRAPRPAPDDDDDEAA
jgi:hypothetical protein